MQQPVHVLFVCLGNICRSPMAEGLFQKLVADGGLSDRFVIESAGTAAYHEGELADPRTREVLSRHGVALRSRARRVRDPDFERFDYILAMDRANLAALVQRCPQRLRGSLHLVLEPLGGGDVPDPYYGGSDGFEENCGLIQAALAVWLEAMLDK